MAGAVVKNAVRKGSRKAAKESAEAVNKAAKESAERAAQRAAAKEAAERNARNAQAQYNRDAGITLRDDSIVGQQQHSRVVEARQADMEHALEQQEIRERVMNNIAENRAARERARDTRADRKLDAIRREEARRQPQEELKAKIRERQKIREAGGKVEYEGDLDGMRPSTAGASPTSAREMEAIRAKGDMNTYDPAGRGVNEAKGSSSYTDANGRTYNHRSGVKAAFKEVWEEQDNALNQANRGWRQRTLDGVKETGENIRDTVTGRARKQRTDARRAYNSYIAEQGGTDFITSNSAFREMQEKFGKDLSPEEMYSQVLAAQNASQTSFSEYAGIAKEWAENNKELAAGLAIGTGLLGGGVAFGLLSGDDDD